MATNIIMPQLGTTMTEGTVEKWLKKVGDPVKTGELLLEISTDKYSSEIEAECDGILRAILVEEGTEVPVLAVLGIVAGADEEIELPAGGKEETAAPAVEEKTVKAAAVSTAASAGRVKASPLAKRVAAELGVDLGKVQPSSKSGRIKEADVRAWAAAAKENVSKAEPVAEDRTIPLNNMRKVIARRMTESLAVAPQVTLTREVCADRMVALRKELNKQASVKISYNDIIVKFTAMALRRVPQMNATFTDSGIIQHANINIGVAVALEDGLLVPVVKNADRKGFEELSTCCGELVSRARAGAPAPGDLEGGTFTVSNLGGSGIDAFTPIVNLPESGILGVGRIVKKPIVTETDEIRVANMLTLSLTFDHRAVDGAAAAKLLQYLASYIEEPGMMYL